MKVPGRAWPVFECEPDPSDATTTRLRQTVVFEPLGLLGMFYRYALYPVHQVVFDGLIDAIRRRAESTAGAA